MTWLLSKILPSSTEYKIILGSNVFCILTSGYFILSSPPSCLEFSIHWSGILTGLSNPPEEAKFAPATFDVQQDPKNWVKVNLYIAYYIDWDDGRLLIDTMIN